MFLRFDKVTTYEIEIPDEDTITLNMLHDAFGSAGVEGETFEQRLDSVALRDIAEGYEAVMGFADEIETRYESLDWHAGYEPDDEDTEDDAEEPTVTLETAWR